MLCPPSVKRCGVNLYTIVEVNPLTNLLSGQPSTQSRLYWDFYQMPKFRSWDEGGVRLGGVLSVSGLLLLKSILTSSKIQYWIQEPCGASYLATTPWHFLLSLFNWLGSNPKTALRYWISDLLVWKCHAENTIDEIRIWVFTNNPVWSSG